MFLSFLRRQYLWAIKCFTGVIRRLSPRPTHLIQHDGVVHHPLGAGSYIFRKNLLEHLSTSCPKDTIAIRIGAQPNSSPHMGTIISFATAFCLAKRLKETQGRKVFISFDMVDTAPSDQLTIDGIRYQRSQRFTGEMKNYLEDYRFILASLNQYTGVEYRIRNQAECLAHSRMPSILREIIDQRDELGPSFSPGNNKIGIRSACPHDGCGLSDKHSIRTVFEGEKIIFECPHHGSYVVDLSKPDAVPKLEFNTPLRNLLRTRAYAWDEGTSWIHLTGADYAGYYQEQLLWKYIQRPPVIFYSPLIVDWSGGKLSKTLYVSKGAYEYLRLSGQEYLVSFKAFREQKRDLTVVFREVMDWVDHPYKLFRSYSIAYIDSLFEENQEGRSRGL